MLEYAYAVVKVVFTTGLTFTTAQATVLLEYTYAVVKGVLATLAFALGISDDYDVTHVYDDVTYVYDDVRCALRWPLP